MSEGAFLTGIDIESNKQKEQKDFKKPIIQESAPKQEHVIKQSIPLKPQRKQLEPLNNVKPHHKTTQSQSQTTKNPANNKFGTGPKRQSVQGQNKEKQQFPPVKKHDRGQVLSQTLYNSKSQQHLGEHKLKSFKSVMDFVKDGKPGRKDKNQQSQQLPESIQFLQKYREKIVKDISNMYQGEYTKVLEELVRLENKQFVQTEILRTENLINRQKKQYNNISYSYKVKQKELKALEENIRKIEIQLTQGSQFQIYEKAVQESQELQDTADNVVFRREALEHMVKDRRKTVQNAQKNVQYLYQENLKTIQELIRLEEDLIKHGYNKDMRQDNLKELRGLVEEYQKALKYEMVVMGQHFEDQFEDQLSEYEDKKALKHIFKFEAQRKEDAERERQEQREQNFQKSREEKKKAQDKLNKEMQEIKHILNAEIEKFQKLERVTGINVDLLKNLNNPQNMQKLRTIIGDHSDEKMKQEINKIKQKNIYILYKESLEQDHRQMQTYFRKKHESEIELCEKRIFDLKDQIQLYKYGEKEGETDYDPNLIETLEQKLILERDLTQDKENQLRRVEKVIDNICIVISRISYQLPFGRQSKDKNIQVERTQLLDLISICGLQLEKMLAILSKKKDTIRIESVNTASDNKSPPDYLGLNNKIIKSIQQQNPKYNHDLSSRVDESLDSMDNFPVKYMGIQQYIYASDKLQDRQVFEYEQPPGDEDQEVIEKKGEELFFERLRKYTQKKIRGDEISEKEREEFEKDKDKEKQ